MFFRWCLLFGAALLLINAACRSFRTLDGAVQFTGWLVITVYLANVITRWVVSRIPRKIVNSEGKAVLITGCDTGFGNELALRLDSCGFTVFAGCLSPDCEGAVELKQRCSSKLHILPLDVTRYDQILAAVKEVETHLDGRDLWALVNNAGVAIFSEIEWCSMAAIEHMFDVNVLGAVRVTKAFLPLLRKCKGRVVVVSSVAGHFTYPGFMSYSMTKHALVSFGDGLRREMRKWGVTVVTIEPSMYRTRITRSDVLTGALDNSWQKTPDPIKEAYGFPYYEDFRGRMQKMAMKARPHLEEVVDSLEQAVREKKPRITYRCSGPSDKVRLWLMSILPVPLLDFLICYVIQPSHRQLSGGNGKTT